MERRLDRQVTHLRVAEPERQPWKYHSRRLQSGLPDAGLSAARFAMAAVLRADVDSITLAGVAQRSDARGLHAPDAGDLRPRRGVAEPDIAISESGSDTDNFRTAGAGI